MNTQPKNSIPTRDHSIPVWRPAVLKALLTEIRYLTIRGRGNEQSLEMSENNPSDSSRPVGLSRVLLENRVAVDCLAFEPP
jgi:hypothetical protein